jgi:hypothetical protein
MLAMISAIGLIGLLAAIFNWEWIYQARGANLLTRVIGRPAMRVLSGLAGVLFMLGPWMLFLLQ